MESSSLKTELAEVKKQLSSEMAERQSQQQQQLLQEANELKSSLVEVVHASLHIHTMASFLFMPRWPFPSIQRWATGWV